jgi:glycerol kinase
VADFVGALDQGTTSTRFMVFDHDGREVGHAQLEHAQILPRPGWVEHDPMEILDRSRAVIHACLDGLGLSAPDLVALGIANQRETTVVWNRRTGRPYCNAIVWQDTRSDRLAAALERGPAGELIRERAGVPPAGYFSGAKLQWILEHVPGVREDARGGEALFGTVDSWLVWHLTGGRHVTDVTNASRTMLMNLRTLDWDDGLLAAFGIPRAMLPQILPSADAAGFGGPTGLPSLSGVPITAVLGDQQAATVGQVCFAPGQVKITYGTGSFLLVNTGTAPVRSGHGLLSTVCYQFAGEPAVYALEGSIAVTGAAVQWLRDQLGVIATAAELEELAGAVEDTEGMYFVPAFSGLFAPHWRADARGAVVGLSRYHGRAHLARATLEAICYQTRDVAEAMSADCDVPMPELKVDGGVTANALCMQLQADILGVPVTRPAVAETTALGAAYAAGLAVGFWRDTDELRRTWRPGRTWTPRWPTAQRDRGYAGWRKAVQRTLDWVEPG